MNILTPSLSKSLNYQKKLGNFFFDQSGGDLKGSTYGQKSTFFNFFFWNLLLRSLKAKKMLNPQITIIDPKSASEPLSIVAVPLNY